MMAIYDNDGVSPAHSCSFCVCVILEDVDHVFRDCDACRQILPQAIPVASLQTGQTVGSALANVSGMLEWVAAAGWRRKSRTSRKHNRT